MSEWRAPAGVRLPRYAGGAAEQARLTVVPRRLRAPRAPFVVLVALVLLGGVLGLLLFNTSMQQGSFHASALESQASALHAKEQSLQMQLDKLRDPQEVATRAMRLGMVPIANPAFLRLPDGTTLGNPLAASRVDAQRITPLPTREPAFFRPRPHVVPWDAAAASPAGNRPAVADPGDAGDGAAAVGESPTTGTKNSQPTR